MGRAQHSREMFISAHSSWGRSQEVQGSQTSPATQAEFPLKVLLGGISLSSHAGRPEFLQAPVYLPLGLTIQHSETEGSALNPKLGQGKGHT